MLRCRHSCATPPLSPAVSPWLKAVTVTADSDRLMWTDETPAVRCSLSFCDATSTIRRSHLFPASCQFHGFWANGAANWLRLAQGRSLRRKSLSSDEIWRTRGVAEVQKEVTTALPATGPPLVFKTCSASDKKEEKKKNTESCAAWREAQQVSGLMHGTLGNYGTADRDEFLFLLLWKSLTDSPASRLFPIRWFIKVMVPILKRYILKVPYDSQFILSRFFIPQWM